MRVASGVVCQIGFMCWLFDARMLLVLCFMELSNDGGQLLSEYNDIQEVDGWHLEEFFSN